MSYLPEAIGALTVLTILLVWLVKLLVDGRRARDADTDALIRRGMRELGRQGRLARHSVMGEIWMDARAREDLQ